MCGMWSDRSVSYINSAELTRLIEIEACAWHTASCTTSIEVHPIHEDAAFSAIGFSAYFAHCTVIGGNLWQYQSRKIYTTTDKSIAQWANLYLCSMFCFLFSDPPRFTRRNEWITILTQVFNWVRKNFDFSGGKTRSSKDLNGKYRR